MVSATSWHGNCAARGATVIAVCRKPRAELAQLPVRVEAGIDVATDAGCAAWSICLPPSPHRALVRAASDLQGFVSTRHGLELKITETSAAKGILLAVNQPARPDRFSIRADPGSRQISNEGSSPLAVYQGVLLLEDRLAERPSLRSNFAETVVYPFKDRYIIWDALLTGQNKGALGFDLESHVREAVRLGYTGMECTRFVGMKLLQQGNPGDPYPWYTYWGPSMDQFVSSPLFEGVFPADYLAPNLADLKRVSETVASFGLKPIFTGYEPRFVPEMFLQRRPDLRGPRVDHPLRSMTIAPTLAGTPSSAIIFKTVPEAGAGISVSTLSVLSSKSGSSSLTGSPTFFSHFVMVTSSTPSPSSGTSTFIAIYPPVSSDQLTVISKQ